MHYAGPVETLLPGSERVAFGLKWNITWIWHFLISYTKLFVSKEIREVIAAQEERLPILLGIAGDCGDAARLERGNCQDKGWE